MFSFESETKVGDLGVTTTNNRGHTIEEVAKMATDKIVSISDTAPAPIKAQAQIIIYSMSRILMELISMVR